MNHLLDIFIFAANAIMPVILIILLGYWLKKKNFFTQEFLKVGNKTVFRVCLPLLLFYNIAEMDSLEGICFEAVAYVLCIVAVLVVSGVLLATLVSDRKQKGVILQCVFRSNFALIGVPLAELIAGSEGVRAAAVLSMFTIPVYNVLSVVALSVYKNEKAELSVKKLLTDIVKNPLIQGVACGIMVLLLKPVAVPLISDSMWGKINFAQEAVACISKASTPLSLLVLGGQFEFQKIKGYRKQITIGVLGRNVIAPMLGVGGAMLLVKSGIVTFDSGIFAAFIALFATPVAVASAIMAEAMDNDGQLAGQLVVWTSLLSVITLFIMILFARGAGFL